MGYRTSTARRSVRRGLRSQGSSEVTDIDFLANLLEYNVLPKSKIVYSNL